MTKSRTPTKPPPYGSTKADKEAEVRKKVEEMQRKRNEQKKVKLFIVSKSVLNAMVISTHGWIQIVFV